MKVAVKSEMFAEAFAKVLTTLAQAEASAKIFFGKLTSLYQISLLIDNINEESKAWILPALNFLKEREVNVFKVIAPLSTENVKNMVAWD